MRHNLLTEPLITLLVRGQREEHSLPSILAQLSQGVSLEFCFLQPHQQHPWYAFLVQLAAQGMLIVNTAKLLQTPEHWRDTLLTLTGRQEEPWCLVVEDLGKPAFMQPPVPEGTLADFKKPLRTPGEIDVLVTAKNFDVKIRRIGDPRPEHWLFALVTKQTAEGVLGQGNYGIARMNGGISSRPCVAIVPSLEWGPRFQRDVGLWLEHREAITQKHGFKGSLGLLWLELWDGTTRLSRKDLHPFFIEICRRIRLVLKDDAMAARTLPTKVTRIFNEGHGGCTGDLWTPVYLKKGTPTTLSLDEAGFHFRRIQDLLFHWEPHPALTPIDGDAWLFAASLCRAQGKTLGYHERVVPIPTTIGRLLAVPKERKRLAVASLARVERTSVAVHSILKPTILALLQGIADGRVDLRDPRARSWLERFEDQVDAIFFPSLWQSLELPEEDRMPTWDAALVLLMDAFMVCVLREVPCSLAQKELLLASAQSRYTASKAKLFPA